MATDAEMKKKALQEAADAKAAADADKAYRASLTSTQEAPKPTPAKKYKSGGRVTGYKGYGKAKKV